MSIKQKIKIFVGNILAKVYGYDAKYLTGRWFEEKNNYVGYNWLIKNARRCNNNGNPPWPSSSQNRYVGAQNIEFHPDDLNNFQHFGCYFQAKGKITIGRGTYIAPNVGIITANHDIYNLDEHDEIREVKIGKNCWIGMNSVILPGTVLGDRTIVGAGSVVTKSFVDGYCIVAGNPAKIIRRLE